MQRGLADHLQADRAAAHRLGDEPAPQRVPVEVADQTGSHRPGLHDFRDAAPRQSLHAPTCDQQAAVPVDAPKLDRMSDRTTPDCVSTLDTMPFTVLEPSEG